MWKLSVVKFLTAYGDIMSSPASTMSMDELETVKPTEGKSLGLNVEGNGVSEPNRGLLRNMVFGPASSDTQQIRPPEDDDGEYPGGIRGKVRQCQVMV